MSAPTSRPVSSRPERHGREGELRAGSAALVLATAALLCAALVWALAGKAIPAFAAGDASRVARLHSPIGYWNALALCADTALVLGIWAAVAASPRREARAAGGLLVYAAVLAGALTT